MRQVPAGPRALQPELGLLIRHPCNGAGALSGPAAGAVKNGNTTHAPSKHLNPSICTPCAVMHSQKAMPLTHLSICDFYTTPAFLEFLQHANCCCVPSSMCDIFLPFLIEKFSNVNISTSFRAERKLISRLASQRPKSYCVL